VIAVTAERDINVPAARAWAVLSRFDDISWGGDMGRIEYEGEGVGMVRRLYMVPGSTTIERLDAMDHENMQFSYSVPEGMPMPIDNYKATVSVTPTGDSQCRVRWVSEGASTDASEQDAEIMLSNFLNTLLQTLEAHLLAIDEQR
tara:strand:- start:28817 stop:29251 length:435 start_codon:yes stop_codon:yes gene_type:complete